MRNMIRIRNLIDYETHMKVRVGEIPILLTGYAKARNVVGTPLRVVYYNGIPGHLLLLKSHGIPVFVPLFIISWYYCRLYEADDSRYYQDKKGNIIKEKYDYRYLVNEIEYPLIDKNEKRYLYDDMPPYTYLIRHPNEFGIFVGASNSAINKLFEIINSYYFIK